MKRLKDIRIKLPKGIAYDVIELGAKLHGAPSLSRYIMTAALSYTQNFLKEKKDELDEKRNEGIRLRNVEESTNADEPADTKE